MCPPPPDRPTVRTQVKPRLEKEDENVREQPLLLLLSCHILAKGTKIFEEQGHTSERTEGCMERGEKSYTREKELRRRVRQGRLGRL